MRGDVLHPLAVDVDFAAVAQRLQKFRAGKGALLSGDDRFGMLRHCSLPDSYCRTDLLPHHSTRSIACAVSERAGIGVNAGTFVSILKNMVSVQTIVIVCLEPHDSHARNGHAGRDRHARRRAVPIDGIDCDDERPGHLIRRLQQISFALFIDQAREFDITPVQYSAIFAIGNHPGIDQTALCNIIAFDRSTIGDVVTRLEKKKLIKRLDGAARPAHQVALHHAARPPACCATSSRRGVDAAADPGAAQARRAQCLHAHAQAARPSQQ